MAHRKSCGAAAVVRGKFSVTGVNAAGATIAFWRSSAGRSVGVLEKRLFGSSGGGIIIVATLRAVLVRTIDEIRLLISSRSVSRKSNSTIAGSALKELRNSASSCSGAMFESRDDRRGGGVE